MSGSWRSFWNAGGWWRSVLLAVGYFVVFQLGSLLVLPLAGQVEEGSAAQVLVLYVIPIALGGVVLTLFTQSVGWWGDVFSRQRLRGRPWMWIAVIVVLAFNVLRLFSTDLGSAGFVYVATWLLAGLMIGFAEELLTRGLVVRMLRRAGHREVVVAVISAAVFAALHAGNLLAGQSFLATLLQLLYTFFFGICMYLALRVTRSMIAPILLHASTDPTIFLSVAFSAPGGLGVIAGLGNIAVIVTGLATVFFIRGRFSSRGGAL